MVNLIDGRQEAAKIKDRILSLTRSLVKEKGVVPGLAAIRVGEDPASQLYVQVKGQQAKELGFHFEEHAFPSWTPQKILEDKILELNHSPQIHGMILQLPLPPSLDKFYLLSLIDPMKDVDGLHPINAGKLFQNLEGGFVPCTPQGCLSLLKTIHDDLKGLTAGIIGTSILVGRPMGMLLLQQGCTIWMAHSKTQDLPSLCKTADILVVAVGKPRLIQGGWIKRGATVIDVGINRLSQGQIVGDVDFNSAQQVAGAITPVPGGVGPMTVAYLLRNTLEAACRYANHPFVF